ncbi:MAG TPA: discoidin domain-containing protein, partial [Chthoniobacterales bacterium]|nr:discoidin domain-containing protein [Chthoniobacterales bacterium]
VIFNDRGFNISRGNERTFSKVSKEDLATIKKLCAKGDFIAANNLAAKVTNWKDGGDGNRHPGFAMFLTIPPAGEVRDYSRTVDFRTGVITVKWSDDRGAWERTAFVSRQDDVVVQYLKAPAGGKLDASIRLGTDPGMGLPSSMVFTDRSDATFLNLRAKYSPDLDAGYEGVTRYVVTGGSHTLENGILKITQADSVLLLTRSAKYRDRCEAQWDQKSLQTALSLLPANYTQLLKGQIDTHGKIYDRVAIDLGASAAERAKTNEELLEEQKASSSPVPALWERIFDSGRFYYLSSSSELTPPDLLGIWTGDTRVGWSGYYHLDANLNFQVSGGNIGDMPEAMEGYFKTNEAWQKDFQQNARDLLGTRGMLAGGNTPGPQSGLISSLNYDYPYQYATGEEAWLLYPFWEHYLITGDKEFLRQRLFPLLKDLSKFYEDFLTETDENGHYIFAGSVSPENHPPNLKASLTNNSVFDISGAKFALSALIETCRILNLEQGPNGGVAKWNAILKKLPPYLVNSDGALKEWAWPGLDDDYGHRHWSHMLTVFPYREITPERTPDLFKAASMTLAKKDEHTITAGHGVLHGALVAAGLKNGDSVRSKLLQLTRTGFYFDSLLTAHYPNHDVFCTDVAHTVPNIMMEMLISSSPGVIELLPALPRGLERGSIRGVKARTRATVDSLSWDLKTELVHCVLNSDIDQSITLIERSGIKDIRSSAPIARSPLGDIARVVSLKAGQPATIDLQLGDLRTPAVNLAAGKPVTVSSTAEGNEAGNAVDEENGTRWASEHADNQWLQVDLGAKRSISEIKINWEAAGAKDYDLQVSDDGKSWKTIRTVTGNKQTGLVTLSDLHGSGRYVRLEAHTRILPNYGFSIWEFQVFGK